VKRNTKNSASVNSLHHPAAGDDLDPAVRSWIDHCIVPNLVKEYLASLQGEKQLAARVKLVAEFRSTKPASGEVTS
jgi:hypothetical protein